MNLDIERSPAAYWHWPKWYWLAGLGLAFFVGLALGNGYTTTRAVEASVAGEQRYCDWQKQTEWRLHHSKHRTQ